MALAYLIDEQIRSWLGEMLSREAVKRGQTVHFVDVGDLDGPPLGSTDPELLKWAAEFGYVLVTMDKKTMPQHFGDFLAAGYHSHGVFVVKRKTPLEAAIDFLIYAAVESADDDWYDTLIYV